MITIFIDNNPYEVEEGQNLLHSCLSLGFDLPYFCWHPAMHSVGACRQCAVKEFRDEKDTKGRIVMSCMTPVRDGMRISIDHAEARRFRASIIEWLMTNHPHDCPVCDEGGECHLQDMTVMTGHTYRRFRFKKRTHQDQDLGPFVSHSMNRCIQCYRCVRFYRDYAGGRDLDVFACHNAVYFGREKSGTLQSEFSGNLVEVCPTGVFTDKTLGQHYTRKWDLQTAPSICVHCGVGCNTIPGERYSLLRRIRNRYNGEVNGYFLCDRGRFGYGFVNSEARIRQPLLKADGERQVQTVASSESALTRIRDIVMQARGQVVGIGSARASLESNFALRRLVGPENFYAGLAPARMDLLNLAVELLSAGPAPPASLADMRKADSIFILGENVPDTAPVMALALRQAARNGPMKALLPQLKIPRWNANAVKVAIEGQKSSFFVASLSATRLDDVAAVTVRLPPHDQARLGLAVTHLISGRSPLVPDLGDELKPTAESIAADLTAADNPLIVSGIDAGSESILRAAASIVRALWERGKKCSLAYVLPDCNSMGLALFGPKNLRDLLKNPAGPNQVLVILENDPYQYLGRRLAEQLLSSSRVVLLDHLTAGSTKHAEVVLPSAAFAESDGTFVNTEGRAQRFYRVFVPSGMIRQGWEWIGEIMAACGQKAGWNNFDELQKSIARELPAFSEVPSIAPPANYRIAGMRIARQPHRYSGRTAIQADRTIHEPTPPVDPNSPFSFSMEGYSGTPPSPLVPRFWAPGWNSVQSVNKFQEEVSGPLRGGDPGKRLIKPPEGGAASAVENQAPQPLELENDGWLIVSRASVFGSDELSRYSPAIKERMSPLCLWVNVQEAERMGVVEGQEVALLVGDFSLVLPLCVDASLPPRVAMVPSWLPGLPGETLPLRGTLRVAGGDQ